MKQYRQFIFENYRFDADKNQIELDYSLDGEVKFTETYDLDFDFVDYDQPALEKALVALWLMAGVSYYKAALPDEIVLKQGSLSEAQAAFFAKTYRLGLGEFFYRNQLPIKDIKFPATGEAGQAQTVAGLSGSMIPVGGGKDSIVTAELMMEIGQAVTTWRVGQNDALKGLIDTIGGDHMNATRTVSPELIRLNSEGALNGHVPISAILSCLAVVCAILSGKQNVVFSNEWSAGEGNAEYEGITVNHQYSKSYEFEKDFQDYTAGFITPSINYFSLLRPFSELKIAELFCNRYLDKYAGLFSSCNRNFHLGDDHALTWCGECPKCAFVFLIFAPFITKQRLLDMFGGRNLFESEKLAQTYQELLGLTGHKPFECVGEIQECRQAVLMAKATGEYPELEKWQFEAPQFDYQVWQPSLIPPQLNDQLKRVVDDK